MGDSKATGQAEPMVGKQVEFLGMELAVMVGLYSAWGQD